MSQIETYNQHYKQLLGDYSESVRQISGAFSERANVELLSAYDRIIAEAQIPDTSFEPVIAAPEPYIPPNTDMGLFKAHRRSGLGLWRATERAYEKFAFSEDPAFSVEDWIGSGALDKLNAPGDIKADIIFGTTPFNNIQSEHHLLWLVGMRMDQRVTEGVIERSGIVSNLGAGFGTAFTDPINMAAAFATGGSSMMAQVAAGVGVAAANEAMLANLDYGDYGWEEAMVNIALSTALDIGVQSIMRGAGRMLRGTEAPTETGRITDPARLLPLMNMEEPAPGRIIIGRHLPEGRGPGDEVIVTPIPQRRLLTAPESGERVIVTPPDPNDLESWREVHIEQIRSRREELGIPEPVSHMDDGTMVFRTEDEAHQARLAVRKYIDDNDAGDAFVHDFEVVPFMQGAGFALMETPRSRIPTRAPDVVEQAAAMRRAEEVEASARRGETELIEDTLLPDEEILIPTELTAEINRVLGEPVETRLPSRQPRPGTARADDAPTPTQAAPARPVEATSTRTPMTEAVSRGARIDEQTARQIGDIIGSDTVQNALSDGPKSQRIMRHLIQSGAYTADDLVRMIDDQGLLTPAGREAVENTILGSVVQDVDVLASIPAAIRQKLVRVTGALVRLKETAAEADFASRLYEAIRLSGQIARRIKAGETFNEIVFLQRSELNKDPMIVGFLESMHEDSPVKFAKKVRELDSRMNDIDNGQQLLLTGEVEDASEVWKQIFPAKSDVMALGGVGPGFALMPHITAELSEPVSGVDIGMSTITGKAQVAVGKVAGEKVGRFNPMSRLAQSVSHPIRVAAMRLFNTNIGTKAHATGAFKHRRVQRLSDVVFSNERRKVRATNNVMKVTRDIVGRSMGKIGKMKQDVASAFLNQRTQFGEVMFRLSDQTIGEIGVLRQMGFNEPTVRQIMSARIERRLQTDDALKKMGVSDKIKAKDVFEASLDGAKGFNRGIFALRRMALTISRSLDEDNMQAPRLRSIMRSLGREFAEDLKELDEMAAHVTESRRSMNSFENLRREKIGKINRQRLSARQLTKGLADEMQKVANLHDIRVTKKAIYRAIYSTIIEDAPIDVDPKLKQIIDVIAPDALSFGRVLTPSFTKTVNIDADRVINAGVRKAVKDVYEMLRAPEEMSKRTLKIRTTNEMLDRFVKDIDELAGEYGVKDGTPQHARAKEDIADLKGKLVMLLEGGNRDISTLDKLVASLRSITSVIMLPKSALAVVIEYGQLAKTTGGSVHLATKWFPRYLDYRRQIARFIKENPDSELALKSALDEIIALDPQRIPRWMEKMGITPEQYKQIWEAGGAQDLLAQKTMAMWMGLSKLAGNAVNQGDIPLLNQIPYLRRALPLSTIGGISDAFQGMAAIAHINNVFDAIPDITKMGVRTALGSWQDVRNGVATSKSFVLKSRAGGMLAAKIDEFLTWNDMMYLNKLHEQTDLVLDRFRSGNITSAQMDRELLSLGIWNFAGEFLPIERPGNLAHNAVVRQFHRLVNTMARNVSTTTPSSLNLPNRVLESQGWAMFFQFLSHISVFSSKGGFGGQLNMFDYRSQAYLASMMIGAAMFDKAGRQWLQHGFKEGNSRIDEQWEKAPANFVADVIGRSGLIGPFELLARPVSITLDGIIGDSDPFMVGQQTEYSVTPPAVLALRTISQGISAMAMRPWREFSDGDRRNLDRMLVVRRTLLYTLMSNLLSDDADDIRPPSAYQNSVRPKPNTGRFRLDSAGKLSSPDSRRGDMFKQQSDYYDRLRREADRADRPEAAIADTLN